DLAAIEARRLPAGERLGGLRGRGEWRECAGGGGRDGGGNDAAAGRIGHGGPPKSAARAPRPGGGGAPPAATHSRGKAEGRPNTDHGHIVQECRAARLPYRIVRGCTRQATGGDGDAR